MSILNCKSNKVLVLYIVLTNYQLLYSLCPNLYDLVLLDTKFKKQRNTFQIFGLK